MPDLLLELLSEEIPARMQRRAAEDLRRLVTEALVEQGFLYEGAKAYATPRRLALHIVGLPAKGRDVREERKGPRVGAPEAALAGFLKSTGLTREQLLVQSDPKKGESYLAIIDRPGRPTAEVLAEIVPAVIREFPWPKAMRWGEASAEPGSLRWVRPLHSILCTFGGEAEEPEIVPFSVGGIASGDTTRGHRFMAPDAIQVRRFDDYVAALERARVVLDADRRADIIRHDARDLAFAQGLEVVEDAALLEEVAGLVEWPVVLMGSFDEAFLAIPPEVIRTTIRANQKCFVLRQSLSPQAGRGRVGESRPGEGDAGAEAFAEAPPHPDAAASYPLPASGERIRGWPIASSWSRTWSPAMAARPSSPATSGWCGHGSRMPGSSGTPTSGPRWRSASTRCAASSSTRSWARNMSASSASRPWPANWLPSRAPIRTLRRARRGSPRPIS